MVGVLTLLRLVAVSACDTSSSCPRLLARVLGSLPYGCSWNI